MFQKVIYRGDINGLYALQEFSSFMDGLRGSPISGVFNSPHNGERYCAWELPSNEVVGLRYYSNKSTRNKPRAEVTVAGRSKLKVLALEARIKEAASVKEKILARVSED